MSIALPYKTCRLCGTAWNHPTDLVMDVNLRVDGYQATVPDARDGLIMLTHMLPQCRSTLAVYVRDFRLLYRGPLYDELHHGLSDCETHCLHQNDLETCQAHCSMSWARFVLQCFRRHELPQDISIPESSVIDV